MRLSRRSIGQTDIVFVVSHSDVELRDAWIDGEDDARWRSASGHGPGSGAAASGSSLLEVPPGCRLPRHTDSAEELIVVLDGEAAVTVDGETEPVSASGVALVPADVPHEVLNAGKGALRFVAVYAAPEVVTRYEAPVQPEGERERRPVSS
jgi:quercetin dioxygenase-like cupin family protein